MKSLNLLLLTVAGMPFVAYAQLAGSIAAVTGADAAVAPPKYQSAFTGKELRPEPAGSRDKACTTMTARAAAPGGNIETRTTP